MKSYSLSHLADHVLLHELASLVSNERSTTADLLAHIAEVDTRRLYARAGFDSMHLYCEQHLGLSMDSAARRIQAARAARRHPRIFAAVADGRLHLTAVCLLAPYLGLCDPEELVAAAERRTKLQIQELLAERFPRPDLPTTLRPFATAAPQDPPSQAIPALNGGPISADLSDAVPREPDSQPEMAPGCEHAPAHVAPAAPHPGAMAMVPLASRPRLTPLAPQRFAFQCTLDHETVDLLRRAQALLGHAMPSGELTQVLKRVLQDWVQAQERRKFGLTGNPRARRSTANGRYVPAELRRQVLRRDGGRCTFVGANGHRCESRTRLEYDHAQPVARGGRTTLENLRLRCRAHNQHEADRVFGAGFMARGRGSARARPARASAKAEVRARPPGLAGA